MKHPVLFPGQHVAGGALRRKGAEAKGVPAADLQRTAHAHRTAQPGLHQQGRVIQKCVSGKDIQLLPLDSEPGGNTVLYNFPTGHAQGDGEQVLPNDGFLPGQRVIPAHDNPPGLPIGQADVVIFGGLDGFQKEPKVQLPPVQPFPDVVPVGAVQLIPHTGVQAGKAAQGLRQHPGGAGLHTAQRHGAADQVVLVRKIPAGLVHQGDDFLRPLLEEHTRIGKGHLPLAANEQIGPQRLLQIRQLAADGGLGDMELLRRLGNIARLGHRQKILQQPQIQRIRPPSF